MTSRSEKKSNGEQLEFEGFPKARSFKCRRCGRALKNPRAIEYGMGMVCLRKTIGDERHGRNVKENNIIPLPDPENGDIVVKRENGFIATNVKHQWVHHSPNGFEFGYGGSGPADFALNILLRFTDRDNAWKLHQDFKSQFLARMPEKGGVIEAKKIKSWLENQPVE